MKKIIKTDDLKLITPLDHVGFIDTDGEKGFISYTGLIDGIRKFSAICMSNYIDISNTVYGSPNLFDSIIEALDINSRSGVELEEVYIFETRKDLFKWLSE